MRFDASSSLAILKQNSQNIHTQVSCLGCRQDSGREDPRGSDRMMQVHGVLPTDKTGLSPPPSPFPLQQRAKDEVIGFALGSESESLIPVSLLLVSVLPTSLPLSPCLFLYYLTPCLWFYIFLCQPVCLSTNVNFRSCLQI